MAGNKRPGIFTRSARAAKRVGAFYIWTVTGNLDDLKANTKNIKEGVKGILNRRYRRESFDDAVRRLKLSENDLNARVDHLSALAFLFGLITLIALIFVVVTPLSHSPVNHALMSIGVMVVAGAKLLTTRFRIAQIKNRKFFEFKDWLFRKDCM